jgi:hypothetical protein
VCVATSVSIHRASRRHSSNAEVNVGRSKHREGGMIVAVLNTNRECPTIAPTMVPVIPLAIIAGEWDRRPIVR